MSTMNNMRTTNKLGINETMSEGVHFEIYKSATNGTNSIKGCVLVDVTFAPPGGLDDGEIEAIKSHVINDPTNDYYAIGLETIKRVRDDGKPWLHMHIRLVKKEPTKVEKQKPVFQPFLAEGRCVWKDPGDKSKKNGCISLKIQMCAAKYRTTCTPVKQMAYALKESMGKYNNGVTHWSNLLDGNDGSDAWKKDIKIFDAEVAQQLAKKERRGERTITLGTQNSMAQRYALENDLQWSEENHIEILATMLADTVGSKEYTLASDYGLKPGVRRILGKKKGLDGYKEMYVQFLLAQSAKDARDAAKDGGASKTRANAEKLQRKYNDSNAALEKLQRKYNDLEIGYNKQVAVNDNLSNVEHQCKVLNMRQIKQTRKYNELIEVCKGQVVEIQNLKRPTKKQRTE